jgi:hypothetical protein
MNRLHQLAKNNIELMDMHRWILNGDLPTNEFKQDSDFSSGFTELRERERLGFRLGSIKKRLRKLNRRSEYHDRFTLNDLPSDDAIYKMFCKSGKKCAITGHNLRWNYHDRPQIFWGVSLDHIVPLSIAPHIKVNNPWYIYNMRILSHIINQIKGNAKDTQTQRWLQQWKCGQLYNYDNCHHYNYI